MTTVKVGVMNLSDTEEARWKEVQKNLDDAKANIKLEFTQFTDYSQPNQAVRDGDVDINAFQHYNYLENWNKENSADLVSVADTYIAPIRLYSGTKDGKNKYTDVKDIPEKRNHCSTKRPNKRKPCLVCIGISWFDQVGYKRWGIGYHQQHQRQSKELDNF